MGLIKIIKPLFYAVPSINRNNIEIQGINVGNAVNQTQTSWVRSANATSELYCPTVVV